MQLIQAMAQNYGILTPVVTWFHLLQLGEWKNFFWIKRYWSTYPGSVVHWHGNLYGNTIIPNRDRTGRNHRGDENGTFMHIRMEVRNGHTKWMMCRTQTNQFFLLQRST